MLENCKNNKIYYVHNLTFETFVFLKDMVKLKIKFKIISYNKIVYSVKIFYKKKKIILKCSYRLTLLSLKNLAIIANIQEKKIFPYGILNMKLKKIMKLKKEDFNNINEYENFINEYGKEINTYNILEEYCKNDVLITKKAINTYWEMIINDNGKEFLKKNILSAAKLSILVFFKENKIIKKKININIDRILRPYYFGGRCEVFGNPKNKKKILHFDYTGMYSQCMSEKVLGGEIISSNIITSLDNPGFYWIKFRQNLEYPILPIKTNKLLFVNGIFEGWYWFEEINLAIKHGVEIIEIKKMITAQYYDFFTKDFVEKNNKIREKGGLYKTIGKNNNNCFYGRIGMNPELLMENILYEDIDNIKDYENIYEKNEIYVKNTKSEKSISNVLFSSSITSKARIKLYKGFETIWKLNGRLLYCDTDSIIAEFDNIDNIINKNHDEIFFDINKEDTIIKNAVFAGPKMYALILNNDNIIVKIKGFNSKPNFMEFHDAFYNKKNLNTMNNIIKKKDFSIILTNIEKKINLNSYDKRLWSNDLKETSPINIHI